MSYVYQNGVILEQEGLANNDFAISVVTTQDLIHLNFSTFGNTSQWGSSKFGMEQNYSPLKMWECCENDAIGRF